MTRSVLPGALALAVAFTPAFTSPASAQASIEAEAHVADAVVRPALDGIFEAFETHPLVGLGEAHAVAQILDFYQTLVRDPRFADNVGHVVVEFGGAAHQQVIDRYLEGEDVPYAELRKVWTDTVGWVPTVPSEGYARFFAQLRQTNLALPPGKRIKVWLGEPPIDWSAIDTREEYQAILATRDSHAARVIIDDILSSNRKALVIYGGGHFERTRPWEEEARAIIAAADPGGPMSRGGNATLRDLVEREYPGTFFVAQTYLGFQDEACTARFEQAMADWPMPALAVDVRGTGLEHQMRACLSPLGAGLRFPSSVPQEAQDRVRALILENADRDRPLLADSLLFYARSRDLTVAAPFIELALDETWRAELSRRNQLITGNPLPPDWGRGFPSAPLAYGGRN